MLRKQRLVKPREHGSPPYDRDKNRIPWDSEDGPYDPNDPEEVDKFFRNATAVYKGQVLRLDVVHLKTRDEVDAEEKARRED